jgi:hypothetical protein
MIDVDPKTKSTEEKAAKLTPEQAAILASASKVESDLSGQVTHDGEGNLIEPEAKTDAAEENAAMLGMLVAIATPAMPFLSKCYTPEVIGNIAGAFTAVEQKYGWNVRSMVGPEFALALCAIPPTLGAIVLGRAHFAEIKERREQEKGREGAKQPAGDGRDKVLGAN